MRSHHPLFFTLSSIFFPVFFVIFTFHHTTSSTTLIRDTCKRCSDTDPNLSYNFCITSLESSPDSRRCRDLHELGLLSMELTKQNVTSTRNFIKHLLKNKKKKLDPYVKACLSDCMVLYRDALRSIKDAMKDFKDQAYDDANIAVSSVTDASTTCEDGFKEKENVVSPLTKRNNDTFQLTAISLSIINMLN